MNRKRVMSAGVFHKIPRIDDARLAEIFGREVLRLLVGKELLSPEWAERLLSWRHTGFSVHSRVRAETKPEAERVGKYMIRPVLALESCGAKKQILIPLRTQSARQAKALRARGIRVETVF
jgi:hypothetical protein